MHNTRWSPVQFTTDPEREKLNAIFDRAKFAEEFDRVGAEERFSQDTNLRPGTTSKAVTR